MQNLLKIISAAATLLVIAILIVVSDSPETPIKTAHADIASFTFGKKSQQKKFVGSLQRLGFEKPRRYNWNGNDVWFTTTSTKESSTEAMQRVTRILKEEGVNRRRYSKALPLTPVSKTNIDRVSEERLPYLVDMLGGGLVPVRQTETEFTLIGNSGAGDERELVDLLENQRDAVISKDPSKLMHQMRTIEGSESNGTTRMTAVWTADEFDPEKIENRGDNIAVDTEVMICPGCNRMTRMSGEEGAFDTTLVDAGNRDPKGIHQFYHRALTNRGWQTSTGSSLSESRRRLTHERSEFVSTYTRGDRFLTVTLFRDVDKTVVSLTQTP